MKATFYPSIKRIFSVLLAAVLCLPFALFFGSCTLTRTSQKIQTEDGYTVVTGYDVTVDRGENFIVKLIRDAEEIEAEGYAFITESQMGQAIAKAYQVLSDGSKVLIEDLHSFALEKDLVSFELETIDTEPVDRFIISPANYVGYYFGNSYSFDLAVTISPASAQTYIKYFSSDTRVAKVNHKGKVTIVGKGTATITAFSLVGGQKATFTVDIKDATNALKDTWEVLDYHDYKLTGNRYDDISKQASSFNSLAYSVRSGLVAVGGHACYDDGSLYGIISYGLPMSENANFTGRVQIDPANLYTDDRIEDIEYSLKNSCFYALTSVKDGTKDAMLLSRINESFNGTLSTFVLEQAYGRALDAIDGSVPHYNSLTSDENYIYLSGKNKNGGVLAVYDFDLKLVYGKTFTQFSDLYHAAVSPDGRKLLLSGSSQNGVNVIGIYDLERKTIATGYSSTLSNAEIADAAFISEDATVIAVASNGTVDGKKVGEIQIFVYNEQTGKFNSSNYKRLEYDAYKELVLTKIMYHYGIISVLGHAKEDVNSGFLGLGKTTYGYAIITNLTTDLSILSGYKYFNSDKTGGTLQEFFDAIVLPDGQMVGVGQSDYANPDTHKMNGYIQYKVTFQY